MATETRVYLLCALSTTVTRVLSAPRIQCKLKMQLITQLGDDFAIELLQHEVFDTLIAATNSQDGIRCGFLAKLHFTNARTEHLCFMLLAQGGKNNSHQLKASCSVTPSMPGSSVCSLANASLLPNKSV